MTKYIASSVRRSDEQYEVYPLWIMGIVEIDLGIKYASAHALRPLISRQMPKYSGSLSLSRSRSPRPPIPISTKTGFWAILQPTNPDTNGETSCGKDIRQYI
ncbi:hypothetical protein PAAG_12293 [Paracoccidioides lutzii Pb01]|uniref:Uncharacterized protein n=1 Tax=Paracoccidioides lutzii (strain ATCC MYA-826 / Pb01) TaxID=502779 RepID=A0A0A2V3T9_PARBA|nr:hypothetical protein PAAG_12293 [Paracoccidioides lutzii Pb01]KGQ01042.1 hypothetical protein PAAG_12293 [Paracoccidioides lutzii Pb01]